MKPSDQPEHPPEAEYAVRRPAAPQMRKRRAEVAAELRSTIQSSGCEDAMDRKRELTRMAIEAGLPRPTF